MITLLSPSRFGILPDRKNSSLSDMHSTVELIVVLFVMILQIWIVSTVLINGSKDLSKMLVPVTLRVSHLFALEIS